MSLLLGIASFPDIAHFLAVAGTHWDAKIKSTTFFFISMKKNVLNSSPRLWQNRTIVNISHIKHWQMWSTFIIRLAKIHFIFRVSTPWKNIKKPGFLRYFFRIWKNQGIFIEFIRTWGIFKKILSLFDNYTYISISIYVFNLLTKYWICWSYESSSVLFSTFINLALET